MDSSSMNNEGTKICHRHTNAQIQRLEAYFKECPHPEDSQRRKLGEELNLRPGQIKFWFQNKRAQVKTQGNKTNHSTLSIENLKLRCENEAMLSVLKSMLSAPYDGPHQHERNLQKLRLDNFILKQEHKRLSSLVADNIGQSIPDIDSSTSVNRPSSCSSTSNT